MNQRRKKFYIALAIFAALGLAIWFTIDDVPLMGDSSLWGWQSAHFTLRRLALAILAVFVLRTVLHWRAETIRAEREHEEDQVLS
jgi:sensor domain CHASE-containing protein